ncbi:hypothetical protein LJC19_04885 [Oxalobacter sp. OttesenSCG-928-P03]|nr:hypothetical protein [Oxalobacter sp. OttesenSCG-928-P03]
MKLDAKKSAITTNFFGEHQIRSVYFDSQHWFFATDVCAITGSHHNVAIPLSKLDQGDSFKATLAELGVVKNNKAFYFVNESGMCELIIQSKSPETPKFAKWVSLSLLPKLKAAESESATRATATAIDIPVVMVTDATRLKPQQSVSPLMQDASLNDFSLMQIVNLGYSVTISAAR